MNFPSWLELLIRNLIEVLPFGNVRDARDKGFTVTPDELEAVVPESTHIVEIASFVPESEIDELYFNSPYFITPKEVDYANEAFAVIREALNQKGMVAVGRVVFGFREHMIAIKPRGNCMIGMTLRHDAPLSIRGSKREGDLRPHSASQDRQKDDRHGASTHQVQGGTLRNSSAMRDSARRSVYLIETYWLPRSL